MVKYRLNLLDGTWVGGVHCLRREVEHALADLHALAALWGQPVVATKVSAGPRHVEIISPIPGYLPDKDSAGEPQ